MRSVIALVFIVLATVMAADFAIPAEQPVIVTFDSLARGEIVSGQYVAEGVFISASNWSSGPNVGVAFDTLNIGESGDSDLEAPFSPANGYETHGDLNPANVLVLHERHDCDGTNCAEPDDESSSPAGWLEFRFAVPSTLHGMTLIDLEAGPEGFARLVLLDATGSVIDTLEVPDTGGSGHWLPWVIERQDVSRARLYLPGDAAVDDIAFTPRQPVNWAPIFTSAPPVAVDPAGIWNYRTATSDLDGDTVTVQLLNGPNGMLLGPDGVLVWSPGGIEGEFPVELMISDGKGASARQSFVIHASDSFLSEQGFEFAAGTIVDDELLADGLLLAAHNLSHGPDLAVSFDTDAPSGGDVDFAAPFAPGSRNELGLGARSPGHVLILQDGNDCDPEGMSCNEPDAESSNPAGWMDFIFSQPAHVWSIDVFDVTSDDPGARQVELLDANGQVLNPGLVLPRTGANKWDRLLVDTVGVVRMRIHLDGEAGFDNLRYSLVGSAEPENRPPVINDEEFHIERDETLSMAAPGVLANDSDPDGDQILAVLDDAPHFGSVQLNADGSFIYVPNPGFVGEDEFEYTVSDGQAASLPEDVEIHVTAPPEAAVIDYFTVSPGSITAGDSTLLEWSVDQAVTVQLSQGIGNVPTTGALSVSPASNTGYTLTAFGSDGIARTASVVVIVNAAPPPPPPVSIEISSPAAGSLLNTDHPEIVIDYLQVGSGIDFGSLSVTINGMQATLSCVHEIARSRCTPTASLAQDSNAFSVVVQDIAGTASNTVTLGVNIDSVAPNPVVCEKVLVTQEPAGTVTATGEAGAAEAGSTVIVLVGAVENLATVAADGSFSTQLSANTGDAVAITVRDAAGNRSGGELFSVGEVPLHVFITSHADGDYVTGDQITVSGSHMGGDDVGINVNGVRAFVFADHSFIASNVPLSAGDNTITAAAGAFDGRAAEASIVVQSNGTLSPVSLTASIQEGPAPLKVRFQVEFNEDIANLHHLELDVDGDGVVDYQSAEPVLDIEHSYVQAGFFQPIAYAATYTGWPQVGTSINVISEQQLDQELRALWAGWQSELQAGNTEAALQYLLPVKRDQYRGVFKGLAGRWAQIFQSFNAFEPGMLSGGFSEYAISRNVDSQDRIFLVYFAQDEFGIWRLYAF